MGKLTITTLAVLALASQAGAATLLLDEDFDGVVSSAIGGAGSVQSVEGYAGEAGFSGNLWRNTASGNPAAATTINLSGIGAHDTIKLDFSLALIETWDLSSSATFGPDFLTLEADGANLFSLSVDPFLGVGAFPSYVAGALPNFDRGFNSSAEERGGVISLSFAHSASTLSLALYAEGTGWQGAFDESWGIDGLAISSELAAVPLPATGWLLLAGLGGMALRRRR